MAHSETTEFYITCNPPLLPDGVDEVITSAAKVLGHRLHEILYEPELPAFKLVSSLDDRDMVFGYVQKYLTTVLNEDTDLAKATNDELKASNARPDVTIIPPGRVTPWPTYDTTDENTLMKYEEHRYPEGFKELDDKIIWRGLEAHDDWNFRKLVNEGFEQHFGCKFKWNKGMTTVYIGNDQPCGVTNVQDAAGGLQNLLDLLARQNTRVKHLVMVREQREMNLVFRSYSQVGFDRTTFLPVDSEESYTDMMQAATIRTIRPGLVRSNRSMAPDHTKYPLSNKPRPDLSGSFEIFDDHVPRLGSAKGTSLLSKSTTDGSTERSLQSKGWLDPAQDRKWTLSNIQKWTREINVDQFAAMSEPSSTASVVPSHLLDGDTPQDLRGADFIPLQYPLLPSLTSDATSINTSHSLDNMYHTDLDIFGDGSDLIEFEDSSQEGSQVADATDSGNQMPADIRELGIAFERLKLRDQIIEHDRKAVAYDVRCLGDASKTDHLESLPSVSEKEPFGSTPKLLDPSSWTAGFLDSMKPELRYLCQVLAMTPGNVDLELRFGRIILSKLPLSEVREGVIVPRDAQQTAEYLEDSYRNGEGGASFSAIMSTCAADATFISRIKPHGKGEWQTSAQGRQVYYDIHCRPESDDGGHFTISVDAHTFEYSVQTASRDLASVFVHCPRSAWDLKMAAIHHSSSGEIDQWEDFIQAAMNSFRVSRTKDKDLLLQLTEKGDSPVTVDEIRQRYVAEYENEEFAGSIMTISLTQVMEIQRKSNSCHGSAKVCQIQARPWTPLHKTSKPNQWVEVTVHSRLARAVFKENSSGRLDFGKKAAWLDSGVMDAPGGVLDELCWPALGMMSQMDDVGLWNDNDQAPTPAAPNSPESQAIRPRSVQSRPNLSKPETPPPRPVHNQSPVATQKKPVYEFW